MNEIITIELPGIKAVSRNETAGNVWKYKKQLNKAEEWMWAYGKHVEHHYTVPVSVHITAFYDTTGRNKCADIPNIDDKIFTDILIRWKTTVQTVHGKRISTRAERGVWFLEDDNITYLRGVTKSAIASNMYKVLITIIPLEYVERKVL